MTLTWYACRHPGRPTDGMVVWHYRTKDPCEGCTVRVAELLLAHPADPGVRWLATMVLGDPDVDPVVERAALLAGMDPDDGGW